MQIREWADGRMGEFALKSCRCKMALFGYLFINADTRMGRWKKRLKKTGCSDITGNLLSAKKRNQ